MAAETINLKPRLISRKATTESGLADMDTSDVNRVILLNVDIKTRNLLAGLATGQFNIIEMSTTTQMYFELEQMVSHVDCIVLGVQLKEPVRVAQRLHSMGLDIPLLILTEPERHEKLKQVLKFTPFLDNDVVPWSSGSLDQLEDVLLETVERAQKRRAYRGSIAAAQKSLGDAQRIRPQISHYLDHLLDHVPIGIFNVDIKGSVLGLNRHASQILKLTEREVLGTSLIDIFPASERQALHDMIAQCVAPARQRSPMVFDVSEVVGTERHVEIMASSLVDRSGQLGATVIIQDVTSKVRAEQERSLAEEALRVSEERYRELVQTMSEALALLDADHRITFVNDSFCAMFGYSFEEVLNRPLLDFVHEEDKEAMDECMSRPVTSGEIQRYETTWVTREGDKKFTLTSPKRLYDPEKGYVGCLGVFTDITERKKIEVREKKHMIELAHASRVTTMGEMSSQIAHELAQPLTAIAALSTGCLNMLKAENSHSGEVIESLTDLCQQASRAREIVLRLRNFVRNEEMQFSPIRLNELVRNVAHLVKAEAHWLNLPLKLKLHNSLPDTLGDRVLLEQVVLNLVRNAIEAMQQTEPEKRQLLVSTSIPDKNHLQVDVHDTGHGITRQNLEQIFDPFFTTKSDGMGMGLAISRSIIDAHGGKLTARTNEEGGTTFSFLLRVENAGTSHAG